MTTAPFLYLGNKDLKKIQQRVTSTKVANMAKQVSDQTLNLIIIIKKRSKNWQ